MIFAFDEFEFDSQKLELRRANKLLQVDLLVLRVLGVLLRNAGRVVLKEELVDEVWEGRVVVENVIAVALGRLRKALSDPRGERAFVTTVYGRGYRFAGTVTRRSPSAAPPPSLDLGAEFSAPRFVGRSRVLSRMRDRAGTLQRGGLIAVLGPPGIGKTHLVEALARDLKLAHRKLTWGFCRESGDTPPLWPLQRFLAELVKDATDAEGGDGPHAAVASLVETTLRNLAAPLGDGPGAFSRIALLDGRGRHRLFDAVARLVTLTTEQTPRVLILEDLHRADGATLALLGHLLDELGRARLLVVATVRQRDGRAASDDSRALAYVLGHRNAERVMLEALSEQDVCAYVHEMLPDDDGQLGRAVYAKSEGIPFFMVELTRQLRDGGRPEPSSLAVADVALDLLRRRIAKLDEATRDVLAVASVIGRSFELPTLSDVLGKPLAELMERIDDAIANDVVVAGQHAVAGFAFVHDLLRGVLYEALAPAARRALHLRVAAVLEARGEDGEHPQASELAYHLHAALPEGDLRKAVHYCRAASVKAACVYANEDVVRYARHALEALQLLQAPSVSLRMHLMYTITIFSRGRPHYAHAARELLQLAHDHGEAWDIVRAALILNPHLGFSALPGSADALSHALSKAQPGDHALRATALAALACIPPHCFRSEKVEQLLTEATAALDGVSAPFAEYSVLRRQLYLRGGPEHDEACSALHDALDRLAQYENRTLFPVLPIELALHRALRGLQRGDLAANATATAQAGALSRELHHRELTWYAERLDAVRQINLGDLRTGAEALMLLHRRAELLGINGTAPFRAYDEAVLITEHTGTPPRDTDGLRRALAYDAGDPPSMWSLKLRALASCGLHDEARAALYALTPEDLARLPSDGHLLGTLGSLTQVVLLLEAKEYIPTLVAQLGHYRRYFSAHVGHFCEGPVPLLLGMLAHAEGKRSFAIERLELAIQMSQRAGLAFCATRSSVRLAECLLASPDPSDRRRGQTLARTARTRADAMEAVLLANEAASLLSRQPTATVG